MKKLQELLEIPRGMGRFYSYLDKMIDNNGAVILPIQGFNPMSKEHVGEVLQKLLNMNAESMLNSILTIIQKDLDLSGFDTLKFCLMPTDDLKGGWTNRATIQLERWTNVKKVLWNNFIPLYSWVTDELNPNSFELNMKRQLYEIFYLIDKKRIHSLSEILELRRESYSYIHGQKEFEKINNPHLNTNDLGILIEFFFGEQSALDLGYTPKLINLPRPIYL